MSTDRPATDPAGTDQIAAALALVQSSMPPVTKGRTASIPGKNGAQGYSYSYADLTDVTGALLPLLTEHGIAWTATPRPGPAGYEVAGVLLHVSGQRIEGSLPLHGNRAQELGSALTYARRYLLCALTGLVADEDDDGARAHTTTSRTRGWDGPSTADLLNRIDADAQRLGITYEAITQKWRDGRSVEDLDALEPWQVKPIADAIHAETKRRLAAQAAEAAGTDSPET